MIADTLYVIITAQVLLHIFISCHIFHSFIYILFTDFLNKIHLHLCFFSCLVSESIL